MSFIRWHFLPEFESYNVFVATPAHDLHSFVQLALNQNAILNLSSARKKQRLRKLFRIVDRGKNSETIFSRSLASFVCFHVIRRTSNLSDYTNAQLFRVSPNNKTTDTRIYRTRAPIDWPRSQFIFLSVSHEIDMHLFGWQQITEEIIIKCMLNISSKSRMN